eukprot:10680652-Alexandrium_andersonii.AAC.1
MPLEGASCASRASRQARRGFAARLQPGLPGAWRRSPLDSLGRLRTRAAGRKPRAPSCVLRCAGCRRGP